MANTGDESEECIGDSMSGQKFPTEVPTGDMLLLVKLIY